MSNISKRKVAALASRFETKSNTQASKPSSIKKANTWSPSTIKKFIGKPTKQRPQISGPKFVNHVGSSTKQQPCKCFFKKKKIP